MKRSQFLLTRFNCPASHAVENLGVNDMWLAHRFILFENFCLPSVLSQDTKDFHWIILIDERTSAQWVDRLTNNLSKVSAKSTVLPVERFSELRVIDEIKMNVTDEEQVILTSRLDNDDAIPRTFLSTVLNLTHNLCPNKYYAINFSNGCMLHKSGIYEKRPLDLNPFISAMSPLQDLKTSFNLPHHKMDGFGTVINVDDSFAGINSIMWMQVVHKQNISNRLSRGRNWKMNEKDIANFYITKNWKQLLSAL